jgi:hypothetical protein
MSQEPDHIILDVGSAVLDYRNRVKVLPLHADFDDHDIVGLIFDYICGIEYAKSNMLEFINDISEHSDGQYPQQDVDDFCRAILTLGNEIVIRLVHLRAFQEGVFWYDFQGFCLNDIVVKRVTKEELVN